MEIIDVHANVGFDVNNLRKNQIPVQQKFDELLAKMDNFNVSKSIIVPFPSPRGQFNPNFPWYDLENHSLINAAKQSQRLIPFPAVNPNDKRNVDSLVTTPAIFGIHGIKISHQIPMNFSIDKLIKHPLMDIVKDNNLKIMLHTGTGKEPGAEKVHTTLNYALEVAKAYPDIKFIICHLGRLHETILETLNLNNVYMDTAGLSLHKSWKVFIALSPLKIFKSSTPSDVIEELIKSGYENKIIFGSDEPFTTYKEEISYIKDSDISEKAKEKIFGLNIKKLLKI